MSSKHLSIKSKLINLKEWLTIPETAKHLSLMLGEEVTDADVLRLALDNHLKLSIYFVNEAHAKYGKVVQYNDVEWEEVSPPEHMEGCKKLDEAFLDSDVHLQEGMQVMKSLSIGERGFLNVVEDVRLIEGVWDLPLIGNERLDVENKYQQLTGGPEVTFAEEDRTFVPVFGTFVEIGNTMCQLQAKFKKEAEYEIPQEKNVRSWYFVPAEILPQDSVLVVRTKALIDFHEKLTASDTKENKSLDARLEKTYLNVIGVLLEIITGTFKDERFKSETQLRDFIAEKFDDLRGLSPRKTADIFAAAKRAIKDHSD